MKRPLCIVFLIIYILAASTVLAVKIEDAMMLRVMTVRPDINRSNMVNANAMYIDDSGMHVFYIEEGAGWENGLRVRALPDYLLSFITTITPPAISVMLSERIILYATRMPHADERVRLVENLSYASDRFLIDFTAQTSGDESSFSDPTAGLPAGFWDKIDGIVAQNELSAVVEAENVPQPFMEQAAKGRYLAWSQAGWRIFSLTDVEQFYNTLPLISFAFILYTLPIVFFLLPCFFRRSNIKAKILWVNLAVSIAALAAAVFITFTVNIPPSMLPMKNIFAVSHYRSELNAVVSALSALQYDSTLNIIESSLSSSRSTLVSGIAVISAAAAAEIVIYLLHSRKRKRSANI